MDSFSDKALEKNYFFSNRDLTKLFIPLIIEQGLEFLVGLIASIMVSRVGEAAVSGVSLVEFLMALFISIFAAFATITTSSISRTTKRQHLVHIKRSTSW